MRARHVALVGILLISVAASAAASPPLADVANAIDLTWRTPLGPGQAAIRPALVPPAVITPEYARAHGWFTRLTAVHVSEAGHEIVFVGRVEEDKPFLSPAELLDAFLVSWRAFGTPEAPGVTIEPRSQDLQKGVAAGDQLDVRYFGEAQKTLVGAASFEADRVLKCLSQGYDNLSQKPIVCTVSGYRSELDLAADHSGNASAGWHRFWIEPVDSPVVQSRSGRTLVATTLLEVRTWPMVEKDGRLVDVDRASRDALVAKFPSATQFATHLTRNYFDYARDFPVLRRLAVFANLAAAAEALKDVRNPSRSPPDLAWLANLEPTLVETPAHTPAITTERSRRNEDRVPNGVRVETQRWLVTGGVTLRPHRGDADTTRPIRYDADDFRAEALEQALAKAREKQPRSPVWTITWADSSAKPARDHQAVRVQLAQPPAVWQQDLQSGTLTLVRDYVAGHPGEIAPAWTVRRPRLRVSRARSAHKGFESLPEWIAVEHAPGNVALLDAPQIVTRTDGQGREIGRYQGFGHGEHSLIIDGNDWVYTQGKVERRSENGGPLVPMPREGQLYVRFSAAGDHHVQEVVTAGSRLTYEYDGDRLTGIANERGRKIRLEYRPAGLRRAVADDGTAVTYTRDELGRLSIVADGAGRRLIHSYDEQSGQLTGIGGDGLTTARNVRNVEFGVWPLAARSEIREPWSPGTAVQLDVQVIPGPGGLNQYKVTINGKEVLVRDNLGIVRTLKDGVPSSAAQRILASLTAALPPASSGTAPQVVVITGSDAELLSKLERSLQDPRSNRFFITSMDFERAVRNQAAANQPVTAPQVIVLEDGMLPEVGQGLRSVVGPQPLGASNVYVVVCHRSADNLRKAQKLLSEMPPGSKVILLMCGVPASSRGGTGESTSSQFNQWLLDEARASYVLSLTTLVNQAALPHFLQRLLPRLREGTGYLTPHGLQRRFQKAVEDFQKAVENGELPTAPDALPLQPRDATPFNLYNGESLLQRPGTCLVA